MQGTFLNSAAILVGASVGTFVIPQLRARTHETIVAGLGLGVVLIGLTMAWGSPNLVPVLVSLALGGLLGERFDLEARFVAAGRTLQRFLPGQNEGVGDAFVQATLIFCVGAMAIQGSIEEGLTGKTTILQAKTVIDGVSAIVFGSALGIGVGLAAASVLLYQGAITLGASLLSPYLTEAIISQLNVTGGLLLVALGLNMLGATKVRVANLLPALPLVGLATYLTGLW